MIPVGHEYCPHGEPKTYVWYTFNGRFKMPQLWNSSNSAPGAEFEEWGMGGIAAYPVHPKHSMEIPSGMF